MMIERKTLRSQVREELLARMRAGDAQPDESINEVQLAAELGVSRTPLREALIGLESEGQVKSEKGKGFRYAKLSAEEILELAPVIATLEGLAIELTPSAERTRLGARLTAMAQEFSANFAEHSLVVKRDDEWHTIMLSECPNSRLLDLIENMRAQIHRYESLLVPDESMQERAAIEHLKIAQSLSDDDVSGAKDGLKVNWVNGIMRILASADDSHIS